MGLDNFRISPDYFEKNLGPFKSLAAAVGVSLVLTLSGCGKDEQASESISCNTTPRNILVSKKIEASMNSPIKIKNKTNGDVIYISKSDWETIVSCMASEEGILVEGDFENGKKTVTISKEGWEAISSGGGARVISVHNSGGYTHIIYPGASGQETVFRSNGLVFINPEGGVHSGTGIHGTEGAHSGTGIHSTLGHGAIGHAGAHGVG